MHEFKTSLDYQQDPILKETQSSILHICVQALNTLRVQCQSLGGKLTALCIVAFRIIIVAAVTFLSWLCWHSQGTDHAQNTEFSQSEGTSKTFRLSAYTKGNHMFIF